LVISLYQSKLTGILAALRMTKDLCQYISVPSRKVTLGCDGLSALDRATPQSLQIKMDTLSHDIIGAIQNLKQLYPVEWSFKYFASHQVDASPVANLDRWGRLKMEADLLAINYYYL
jgi:hypothetical protein